LPPGATVLNGHLCELFARQNTTAINRIICRAKIFSADSFVNRFLYVRSRVWRTTAKSICTTLYQPFLIQREKHFRFLMIPYRYSSCSSCCCSCSCWGDLFKKSSRLHRFKSHRDEIWHNCSSSEYASTDEIWRRTFKMATMTSFREAPLARRVWRYWLAVCAVVGLHVPLPHP